MRNHILAIFMSSVMLCVASCRQRSAEQEASLRSDPAANRFEFVNAQPQFNVTKRFFAAYIGIWRGFSAEEKSKIAKNAALLSQREVSWSVLKCGDGALEHQDRDVHWAIDELALDADGNVEPIMEANRPNYRYFSLLNLHGLYMRGTGDHKRTQRLPDESWETFKEREEREKEDWWNRASPIGTKGTVDVKLTMKFVSGLPDGIVDEQFIRFENYESIGQRSPEMRDIFVRTAPSRWPVSYDERAHKPHAFAEPKIWSAPNVTLISNDEIRARLEWNWCNREAAAPEARVLFPPGRRPAPGPNRAGRESHGAQTIEVIEREF